MPALSDHQGSPLRFSEEGDSSSGTAPTNENVILSDSEGSPWGGPKEILRRYAPQADMLKEQSIFKGVEQSRAARQRE